MNSCSSASSSSMSSCSSSICSITSSMQALSLEPSKSLESSLTPTETTRALEISNILTGKYAVPVNIIKLIIDYDRQVFLDLSKWGKPERLLDDCCSIACEDFEKLANPYVSAKPRRYYFAAMVMDAHNNINNAPVFDAGLVIRHLTTTDKNPLSWKEIEHVYYFVVKKEDFAFSYFEEDDVNTKIDDWILANSLEKSEEIQTARKNLLKDPTLSDEDFLHLMELACTDQPKNDNMFQQLFGFIKRDKNKTEKLLQKIAKENLFYTNISIQDMLGRLCYEQHYFVTAASYYRRAIQLNKDNGCAHACLGNILTIHNDYDEASLHLKKAIQLNENDGFAHGRLGHLLKRQHNYKDAKKHLAKAVQFNENDHTARADLANVLAALEDYKNARKHLAMLPSDGSFAEFIKLGLAAIEERESPQKPEEKKED